MKKDPLVKLLQELVETQRKLITELEKRPVYTQTVVYPQQPYISIPSVWQVRCNPACTYDPLGTAGGLRYCKVCGQQELPYTITVTSAVSTGVAGSTCTTDGKPHSDGAQLTFAELPKTNGQFFVGVSPNTISRP